MKLRIPILFTLVILAASMGCRKDVFTTDSGDKLEFSRDTVLFDTVFTTVGSATRRFTIRNPHDKSIKISKINLAGGASSNFRLNIDGVPGIAFENIEIPPNDSLWVFTEVTLDPNNQNTPMIITDSVTFVTNGNIQDVDLVAWGQDAYFYGQLGFGVDICHPSLTNVWNNDKPHVIYGYVLIPENCTLTINEGTRVHCHANSGIVARKGGTLLINGTAQSPVVIQGDRLEENYKDIPGQWAAIIIESGSYNSVINHALIKNASVGVLVDGWEEDPETNEVTIDPNTALTIKNTIVQNSSGMSIWAKTAKIKSTNCVFGSAGQYSGLLTYGGDYDFRHCTFANYYSYGNRQTPLLLLNNYFEQEGQPTVSFDLNNAYFGNCIFDGNLEEELGFDDLEGGAFNYFFDRCMVKVDPSETDITDVTDENYYKNPILNQDSIFVSTHDHNFKLSENSPAIDKGDPYITSTSGDLFLDLEGNSRKLTPDIGAHERH